MGLSLAFWVVSNLGRRLSRKTSVFVLADVLIKYLLLFLLKYQSVIILGAFSLYAMRICVSVAVDEEERFVANNLI